MYDVRIQVNGDGDELVGQIFIPAFIDEDGDARLTGGEASRAGREWLFAYEFDIVPWTEDESVTEQGSYAEPPRLHKITLELTTAELFAVSKALAEVNN